MQSAGVRMKNRRTTDDPLPTSTECSVEGCDRSPRSGAGPRHGQVSGMIKHSEPI
jgi:hypothetical protein